MVRSNRGGDDLTRSLKRNERIDDITRTYFTRNSEKKRTYLTRSSTKNKRIDDLTRSLKKNKRNYPTRRPTKNKTICNEGERTGLLISGDVDTESNHVLSELSDEVVTILSRSVVSLSLCDEHTVLFKCSAIAVQLEGPVSVFMTSVSLVKAFNDKRKDHDNLKVEVRHGDNVVIGSLGGNDFDHDVAIVNVDNVDNFPRLNGVVFRSLKTFPCKVVAVGRDISGNLIATSGILNFEAVGGFPSHMLSTCKISKEYEGGPLYDLDGNFLGMNLSSCTEGTLGIRVHDQWLKCLSLERIKLPAHLNSFKEARFGESSNDGMPDSHQEVHKDVPNEDQFGDLESLGYPECPKSMSTDDITLAYRFEEPFGDLHGEGVWRELSETAASNIHGNIVALASFDAASLIRDSCYGKETVKNLKIKVLLPNKNQVDGILQHYNLHYNIALVNVNDYCPRHPAKIEHLWDDNREVLAVGYIFESGKLMASRGRNVRMSGTLDCKFLEYSTCRITKAGIGGPLLDFDGNFVGINFYDEYTRGTPFLLWDEVLDVLGNFKERRNVIEAGDADYASDMLDWTIAGDPSVRINSWPVPSPFWRRREALEKKRYRTQARGWANNNIGL